MKTLDVALVGLVLSNLWLLGSSRMSACIRIVALQGILVSLVTLAAPLEGLTVHVLIMAAASGVLKTVVFPRLLARTLREVNVRREVEPFIGFTTSVLAGTAALGISIWIASRLPLPGPVRSSLVVPTALSTMLTGLLLILSRRKALSGVIGYIVLENGIYTFGVALALREPVIVELGVLLDVFVAVFVMGITIFNISREFAPEADRLDSLKD